MSSRTPWRRQKRTVEEESYAPLSTPGETQKDIGNSQWDRTGLHELPTNARGQCGRVWNRPITASRVMYHAAPETAHRT